MSGRFTPAAATCDQHFAGPGRGTGRSTTRKLFCAVRLRGDDGLHGRGTVMLTARALIDSSRPPGQRFRMDLDDLFPSKPGDPLVELAKQDLDPLSIEELHARIEGLKAEIARVEAHMAIAPKRTDQPPKSCSRSSERVGGDSSRQPRQAFGR